MRYFTDERLQQMREELAANYGEAEARRYRAWLTHIEILDKRNDQYGDCRDELMQAIAQLERETERYVHRGRANPQDEDNDAFEYENYGNTN
ncbi:MAG: hypothetical protein VZR73_08100 [Acutalibacteraceae bacterium]|nr:hypothetical protein [Clostridia bacterium]MEE3404029.1 hypothetical protein [Acutalibacteraceae bacterium]